MAKKKLQPWFQGNELWQKLHRERAEALRLKRSPLTSKEAKELASLRDAYLLAHVRFQCSGCVFFIEPESTAVTDWWNQRCAARQSMRTFCVTKSGRVCEHRKAETGMLF